MNLGSPVPQKTDKKKQIIAGIVTLVTLIFVFGIVFPQFADYGEAWDAIQTMSTISLVLLLAMTVVLIIVYVWPYQASLPGLKYGPGFVVRQTSFLISNVIPAGVRSVTAGRNRSSFPGSDHYRTRFTSSCMTWSAVVITRLFA